MNLDSLNNILLNNVPQKPSFIEAESSIEKLKYHKI